MEENKMQELSLDEMDKVSGGKDLWTRENGKFYWNREKCACGGRWYMIQTELGGVALKCEGCGSLHY